MVGRGAIDTLVYAARFERGPKLKLNRLRIVLVKPAIQFFPLLRRNGIYRSFDSCTVLKSMSLPLILRRVRL